MHFNTMEIKHEIIEIFKQAVNDLRLIEFMKALG